MSMNGCKNISMEIIDSRFCPNYKQNLSYLVTFRSQPYPQIFRSSAGSESFRKEVNFAALASKLFILLTTTTTPF